MVSLVLTWLAMFSASERPEVFPDLVANASAAYQAHKYPESMELYERCVAVNPISGRAWDNLGLAAMRCGKFERAVEAFHKYKELGSAPASSSYYNLGCAYALWGKKDLSLQWLQKSLDGGWRSVHDMASDEDLASLRGEPHFKKMVGEIDKASLSRTDGLRYDIEFMKSELFRRHYNPFRLHSREEFESAFSDIEAKVPQLNDDQVWVELQRIMAMAGDAHTSLLYAVLHGDSPDMLPMDLAYLDGHLVIQAADPEYKDLVGGEILSIEGVSVPECRKRLDPYISRDNSIWPEHMFRLLARNIRFLHGVGLAKSAQSANFTVHLHSGDTRVVTVKPGRRASFLAWVSIEDALGVPVPLYRKEQQRMYRSELIDGGHTIFLKYNQVADDPAHPWEAFLNDVFATIESKGVDNLIVDMRDNGGGHGELVTALTTHIIRSRVNKRGHLFIITGRRSISATLISIGQLTQYANPILVGEPTGSAPNVIGEAVEMNLPYSGFAGAISDTFHQTSNARDNSPWYTPSIFAPPTLEAIRAGRDPALEAIRGYLRDHKS